MGFHPQLTETTDDGPDIATLVVAVILGLVTIVTLLAVGYFAPWLLVYLPTVLP